MTSTSPSKASFLPASIAPIWLRNVICALLIYPFADFIAQTLTGQWVPLRLPAVAIVGTLIYRVELSKWYAFIETLRLTDEHLQRYPIARWFFMPDSEQAGRYRLKPIFKGACGTLYFNPIWIIRHMLVLELVTHSEKVNNIGALFTVCFFLSLKAFAINSPISLCLNYILQNKVPLQYRFIGSLAISCFFAVMYSLVHYILR